MKTLSTIFVTFVLTATCLRGVHANETTNNPATVAQKSYTNTPASNHFFLTCMGRYASYFRSFMPFDDDPCNHIPSSKSVC